MIENQYKDLFSQYRPIIDEKSAEVLNSARNKASNDFGVLGFPTDKMEDFHYSDIASKFAPDFGLNINQIVPKINPYIAYKCNVPDLSTKLYFLLNDIFAKEHIPPMEYPKGIFVGSLKDFATEYPEVCKKYYAKIADTSSNGVVAFNTMFAQDGFAIYVPKNIVVEQPIQLINILTSKSDYLVNRRVLIIAEENAQVKLLACDHAVTESNFLVTQVTELFADKNARIEFYELEENSEKTTRIASTFAQQAESSNIIVNNVTLNCGFTRNNYRMKLDGEYAEATVAGMVIADKQHHVDNFAFLDHAKPNCQSTQLFKYVLQESAKGVFCGRILVEKDAQKTMAYQTNRNLCTSPDSRMYAKPQLEIYADDVKCSHGLTTGQIDEDALFYMRSRGIPEKDARLLLMQAFTSDVIDLVNIEALQERLHELVEKRFRGEVARCGNCAICR